MKNHVISLELLSCLFDLAHQADQLVNLVLDGKPYAIVMRELILELNNVDNLIVGNVQDMGADLMGIEFDRAEMRNGSIWLFEKEEEPCPAKT